MLGGCVLLALVLRIPWAMVGLGNDEGGVAWVASQWDVGTGWLYGGAWLDRPPLLVVLFKAAIVGGAGGVRVLGALAAVAIVLAVFVIARRLADERAGLIAAGLAALLTGAGAIEAPLTPAELPAAAFAAWAVAALVHDRFAVAGLLAACAVLTKQSFLDAGAVGLVVALASRRLPAFAAGAAVPAVVVGLWLLIADVNARQLYDALLGFRFDALESLQGGTLPLRTRLGRMEEPTIQSGLILLGPLSAYGLFRVRPLLLVWPVVGLVGVLAGGSYWPHYLIQLIAPAAVGAALVLARLQVGWRVAAFAVVIALSAFGTLRVLDATLDNPTRQADEDITDYVRARSEPGDTIHVLYARASLNYTTGLRAPHPYAWSLMARARPDARPRLLRLLNAPDRPVWLVRWQSPNRWGLDPDGAVARALRTHYRRVAVIGGKPVLKRR